MRKRTVEEYEGIIVKTCMGAYNHDRRHPWVTDASISRKVGKGEVQEKALNILLHDHVLIEETPVSGYGSREVDKLIMINPEKRKAASKKFHCYE